MSEKARTIGYASAAAVSLIAAFGYHAWSQPAIPESLNLAGKPFYPDFEDPGEAVSIEVSAFKADSIESQTFRVEQQADGSWSIPSHYDYPADGRDRLRRTANSLIGIVRGPSKTDDPSLYAEYGVVDPRETLKEDLSNLKGRGQRVTLKRDDDTTLVDFIIGAKAEGEGNRYYVRTPSEPDVYLAELDIDLSTKFTDWIEDDFLKVNRNDLRELKVNKYSVDERAGGIVDQELSELTREKSFDPWKLVGIDEEKEEVNKETVDGLVDALDGLKIIDVRPKPKGINADLTIDPALANDRVRQTMLAAEMQSKGFFIGKKSLIANEGNFIAATDSGVVYTLNFGEVFTGSDGEIKVAGADDKDGEKKDDKDAPNDPFNDADEEGRYLFIAAAFDAKYLGPAPVKPTEPVKPAGLREAAPKPGEAGAPEKPKNESPPKADDPKAPAKKDADDEPGSADENDGGCFGGLQDDSKQEENKKDEQKGDPPAGEKTEQAGKSDDQKTGQKKSEDPKQKGDTPAAKPTQEELEEAFQTKLKADWEAAQTKYKQDVTKYEADKKAYEKKIEDGEKAARELNERFGAWYYVISGSAVKNLRLSRSDLVKPKEKKKDEKKPDAGVVPGGAAPGTEEPAAAKPGDGDNEKTPVVPKETKKPESEKKPAEDRNEKPAGEKPADRKGSGTVDETKSGDAGTKSGSGKEKTATTKNADPDKSKKGNDSSTGNQKSGDDSESGTDS